jgi:hypothetical protein
LPGRPFWANDEQTGNNTFELVLKQVLMFHNATMWARPERLHFEI